MGTLFRIRVGSDNLLPQSVYAQHLGPLTNNAEWQTMTCPISACSDLFIMWDNSAQKWLRVTADRARNG